MKILNVIGITMLAFGLSFNAQAFGLGGLASGGKGSGGGGSEQQIDDFIKTAEAARTLTSKSAEILAEAMLTKEENEKLKADMEAANAKSNPKEKDAAIQQVEVDRQAALAKVDYEKAAKENIKKLDAKKKSQISTSIYNFMLGLLKDKELVKKGSSLVSSASSNPMLLGKIGKVKDSIGSITGQMENMTKIAAGLQKLASSGVISVSLPKSESEPAKETSGD